MLLRNGIYIVLDQDVFWETFLNRTEARHVQCLLEGQDGGRVKP